MPIAPIIDVRDLSKEFKTYLRGSTLKENLASLFSRKYKIHTALKNINLKIAPGEFVGIIGPNGAGKSTLIKILTGILVPTNGKAIVNGLIPYESREKNARQMGVVFGQRTQLWWDIPVRNTLELLKAIYEIPESAYKKRMKKFSSVLGIEKYLDQPTRKLSLGERMRCELAACLLHGPPIVYLDEPTIGLDVEGKHRMREFLKEVNKEGTTIILTTHDMGDIEELCERIIIVDLGKIIYDGSFAEIKKKFGRERILIADFHKPVKKIPIAGVKIIFQKETHVKLSVDTKKISLTEALKKILSRYPVHDIEIEEPDIEEIIRRIYREGI